MPINMKPESAEWEETEEECPECGENLWQTGWWDDLPEAGGSCIGDWLECRTEGCDYFETR